MNVAGENDIQTVTPPKENLSDLEKRILEFAFNAFGQKGFKALAVDIIAKELHVSKKTIYKIFRTKEELLERSFEYQFAALESRLTQINLEASGGFTSFLALCTQYLNLHSLFPQALRAEISQEIPHLDERVSLFESLSVKKRINRLLKSLRSQDLVSYPSPTREFVNSLCMALRGMLDMNRDHFEFILKNLFRGISLKAKKKKKKSKA